MADAHGSGPCGRKSLRVQLPFRPFLFFGFKRMKKYDQYRPSSFITKRTPRRRKNSLKPVILLLFSLFILVAAYVGLSKGYAVYASSDLSNWKPKEVILTGNPGRDEKALMHLAQNRVGKPFTLKQAAQLRAEIMKKYPMFRQVEVNRGLFSGTLKIAVTRREPVAKFVLPNGRIRFIDSDSTVYADPAPELEDPIPFVEFEGDVPEKLSSEVVDLVQNTLKLKKDLAFDFLRFNLSKNLVSMHMPDGSIIEFGPALHLKEKSRRAAQIMDWCRKHNQVPQRLDFRFFEDGQVFLTQKG